MVELGHNTSFLQRSDAKTVMKVSGREALVDRVNSFTEVSMYRVSAPCAKHDLMASKVLGNATQHVITEIYING